MSRTLVWLARLLTFAAGCSATGSLPNDSGTGTDSGAQTHADGLGETAADVSGQAEPDAATLASVPGCLRASFAACPTDGVCYSKNPEISQTNEYCFASGAKATFTLSGGCSGDGHIVLEVRKPDGSPCYTSEVSQGYFCESETFIWKDPTGRVIATGGYAADKKMFQCATGGERFTCTDDVQCKFGSFWAHRECQPGSCP